LNVVEVKLPLAGDSRAISEKRETEDERLSRIDCEQPDNFEMVPLLASLARRDSLRNSRCGRRNARRNV